MKRFMLAMVAAFAVLFLTSSVVVAAPPLDDISTPVVDTVDALNDEEVLLAIQRVEEQTNFRLSVVFVDSFDGMSGAMWATRTAQNSGLQPHEDILFVVATQERAYGSAFPNGTVVARKITGIEEAALPHLGKGEWTNAVVAYADSVINVSTMTSNVTENGSVGTNRSENAGSAVTSVPTDYSGVVSFFKITGLVILIIFLLVLTVFGVRESQRRKAQRLDQEEKVKGIPVFLATFDELLRNFDRETDYVSAEFPGVNLNEARERSVKAHEALDQAFRLGRGLVDSTRSLVEKHVDATSITSSLTPYQEFIVSKMQEFDTLRKKAATASDWADQTQRNVEALLRELDSSEQKLNSAQVGFDQTVFTSEHTQIGLGREDANNAYALIEEARSSIRSSRKGHAVAPLERADSLVSKHGNIAAIVVASVSTVMGAAAAAGEMLDKLRNDTSWLRESNDRMGKVGAELYAVEGSVTHFEGMNFSSGNPLPPLTELKSIFSRFHETTTRIRVEERKVQEAREAIPGKRLSAEQEILQAQQYRSSHSSDVSSGLSSELSTLSSCLDSMNVDHDPVQSLREIQSISEQARDVHSKMKRSVRSAQDERDRKERQRRDAARVASSISVGRSGGSSFGSSGGSFGSGGSGGKF